MRGSARYPDKTGTAAEPFSLPAVDGTRYRDADFAGGRLLLVFLRHLG